MTTGPWSSQSSQVEEMEYSIVTGTRQPPEGVPLIQAGVPLVIKSITTS
tara:strand:- start:522 stop:668 length:147 start_codon:yes stop_codon:yes gene_type:complete